MKPGSFFAGRVTRDAVKRAAGWAGAVGFAIVHTVALWACFVVPAPQVATWLFPLVAILPGIVTMTLLPGGWKYWYRWAALLALLLNAVDPFSLVLVAVTWLMHRSWVTERVVPVKDLFRRGSPQAPSLPAKQPKGFRTPNPV